MDGFFPTVLSLHTGFQCKALLLRCLKYDTWKEGKRVFHGLGPWEITKAPAHMSPLSVELGWLFWKWETRLSVLLPHSY